MPTTSAHMPSRRTLDVGLHGPITGRNHDLSFRARDRSTATSASSDLTRATDGSFLHPEDTVVCLAEAVVNG